MALNYVVLTLDLYDGTGTPVGGGRAFFAPNTTLTNTTDHQLIGPAVIAVPISAGGLATVHLLATDSTPVSPSGWQWTVWFEAVAGMPGPTVITSFLLPFSGGAAQYWSSISPVASAPLVSGALPLAGGTMSGAISMAGNKITNLAAGTNPADAVTFAQVSGGSGGALPLTGGTMSGPIAMGSNKVTGLANGTAAADAAAFGQISGLLSRAGGTMTGAISMGGSKITGLGNGTAAADAAAFGQLRPAITAPAPSGDTTGATDFTALTAAITACPAGSVLQLRPGIYITSAPLVISKRIILQGADAGFGWGIYANSYPGNSPFEPAAQTGTVIQAATGWAQGPAAGAALLLLVTGSSHYITEGPVIRDICLSGTTGTGSGGVNMTATAAGILAIGAVVNVIIDNVMIMYVRDWGLNCVTDPSAPGGSVITTPGTWRVSRLCVYNCAGGVSLDYVDDSRWSDCLVIGCAGNGWRLQGTDNTHFTNCRAEWNGASGFWLTGSWNFGPGTCCSVAFTGCSTDANSGNGMLIDATTGDVACVITSMFCRRDSNVTGGGTAAALAVNQTAATHLHFRVYVRGFVVTATTAAFLAGPHYGLSVTGTGAWLDIDGAYLIGSNNPVNISGTPAFLHFGPGVSYWSGTSDAPVAGFAQPVTIPGDLSVTGTSYVSALNVFGGLNLQGTALSGAAGLAVIEGTNARQGTAVLVAGSKVVATTEVTATSRIFLTSNADGGTPGWLRVSARTPGTSFTITSSSGADTSTVAYEIFEPG